jgi:hypothetical protein
MKWSLPYVLVTIAGLVYQLSEGVSVHPQNQIVIDGQAASTKSDSPCLDNSKLFADCDNDTVTDQVTGLNWLQRANCTAMPGTAGSNLTNWPAAMAGVAAPGDGLCGLSARSQSGEWRLPTEEEWEATIGYARDGLLCSGGLFPVFPNDSGTGCHNLWPPAISSASFPIATGPRRWMNLSPVLR